MSRAHDHLHHGPDCPVPDGGPHGFRGARRAVDPLFEHRRQPPSGQAVSGHANDLGPSSSTTITPRALHPPRPIGARCPAIPATSSHLLARRPDLRAEPAGVLRVLHDPNPIEIWMEQPATISPAIPARAMQQPVCRQQGGEPRSKEIIAAGDDHPDHRDQVCTTDENDVRNQLAPDLDGKARSGGIVNPTDYDPAEFDRPNCNNHWREKRLCIGNRVAVGLKANDDSAAVEQPVLHHRQASSWECAHVEDLARTPSQSQTAPSAFRWQIWRGSGVGFF